MTMPHDTQRVVRSATWILLMVVALLVIDVCWGRGAARADDGWTNSHASSYGNASIYDGGYWREGRWQGYWGATTAWGHHCGLPEHFAPANALYSWAVMTRDSVGVANRSRDRLGTWIEMRIPLPDGTWSEPQLLVVSDAGPYAWWSWDIQEPVIWALGWRHAGPPRYGPLLGPQLGHRDVLVRDRSDLGRYCPRLGFTDASAQPAHTPLGDWYPMYDTVALE